MENIKLDTKLRTDGGKGVARKLRATGVIPAVLYGQKEDPVSLIVDESEFRTILLSRPESSILDLNVEGADGGPVNVIIRDVQKHPATGRLLHIDFQRIRLDEKIRMEVAVSLQGEPRGVKEQGGILEHGTRSLNVMCLPTSIPESVDIDVSELMIGDSIRLKDVMDRYPDVDFQDDDETSLAHVMPPVVEAEPVAEDEEGEGEPELVDKDKEGEEKEKDEEASEEKSS
jgi:large subunit ribosomal protein L25